MSDRSERDPFLEHDEDDGEWNEILERSDEATLQEQREQAQGVEVFEDPDAALPAEALKEGPPGEETLTGDGVGLGRGDEDGDQQPDETG